MERLYMLMERKRCGDGQVLCKIADLEAMIVNLWVPSKLVTHTYENVMHVLNGEYKSGCEAQLRQVFKIHLKDTCVLFMRGQLENLLAQAIQRLAAEKRELHWSENFSIMHVTLARGSLQTRDVTDLLVKYERVAERLRQKRLEAAA